MDVGVGDAGVVAGVARPGAAGAAGDDARELPDAADLDGQRAAAVALAGVDAGLAGAEQQVVVKRRVDRGAARARCTAWPR